MAFGKLGEALSGAANRLNPARFTYDGRLVVVTGTPAKQSEVKEGLRELHQLPLTGIATPLFSIHEITTPTGDLTLSNENSVFTAHGFTPIFGNTHIRTETVFTSVLADHRYTISSNGTTVHFPDEGLPLFPFMRGKTLVPLRKKLTLDFVDEAKDSRINAALQLGITHVLFGPPINACVTGARMGGFTPDKLLLESGKVLAESFDIPVTEQTLFLSSM